MRANIDKKHYTKPERILARLLQENKIPFEAKVKIADREIDFLIGKIAIEVDGHEQDGLKNSQLVDLGYHPIHFTNQEILSNRDSLLLIIKQLYGYN